MQRRLVLECGRLCAPRASHSAHTFLLPALSAFYLNAQGQRARHGCRATSAAALVAALRTQRRRRNGGRCGDQRWAQRKLLSTRYEAAIAAVPAATTLVGTGRW